MSGRTFLGAAAVCALVCQMHAYAGTTTVFRLSDHPDAEQSPPPYGLRADDLFANAGVAGATGGVTTFSFDTAAGMFLRVISNGMGASIEIFGTVFGGESTGNSYTNFAGEYALNITYDVNVNQTAEGWVVSPGTGGANSGTLTALGDYGNVSMGDSFDFFALANAANHEFVFEADGFRLPGDTSTWVGRGWLTENMDGTGIGSVQDILFIATPVIPTPTAGVLSVAGLGLCAARRRRI